MSNARLHDVLAVRAVEARATARLGDGALLMQRAGQAAWQVVLARWPRAMRIVVACGPGNNGGDGYVLAQHALESGRDVVVLRMAGHEPRRALARQAAAQFTAAGGRVLVWAGAVPPADLIVDALFGIGLTRTPLAEVVELFEAINGTSVPVLALDVPSGVDADAGPVRGAAINADATVEFLLRKRGLATGAALDHVGQCLLADLGVTAGDVEGVANAADWVRADSLPSRLPRRARDSHKGRHGRVLCLGGDVGHGGAIVLAAEAALRVGAGLVDVGTRAEHVTALLARRPEAMARAIDEPVDGATVAALVSVADVIAIGPGLGQGPWGAALLDAAIASGKPMVLDADALNLLGSAPRTLPAGCVLTPHPGEAARLLSTDARTVQRDRFHAVDVLSKRFNAVVVLKGAGTLVAAPGATTRVIGAGNSGMAVGGMGDVLTGVIASLRAQGIDALNAATAGALLHAVAGDEAAIQGQIGLLPSDLMVELRRLRNAEQSAWKEEA